LQIVTALLITFTIDFNPRIIEKLTDLGWGDEIEDLNDYDSSIFSRHPVVNQPKDLTERSAYDYFASHNAS
jgi:hypothetical protein